MNEIEVFSLEKHDGSYEEWPSKTRFFINGEYNGTKVPGYVIEKQFELENGYLLITSQDCPFEESNDFILMDKHYKIIAKKSLMQWYESFLLEDYQYVGTNEFIFKYYGGFYLRVKLFIEKRGWFAKRIELLFLKGFNQDSGEFGLP